MRFEIKRTSQYDGKPCECAFSRKNNYYGPIWEIEINTLEELLKIVEKEGDIIMNCCGGIEIYDDFREK